MSGTIEKKTISSCDCPSSKPNRDVIVITIETCCKRTCDGGAKAHHEEESTPRARSSTHLAHSDPSRVAHSEPSHVNFSDGDGDSEGSNRTVESSFHAEAEPSNTDVDQREPSAPKLARSESRVIRTVSTNAPGSVKSEHSLIIEEEEKPVFKLPVLVERHHGHGCAMEISVLEKHDDSCVYRKGAADGRSIDDRVGSYECIGRMVFRTCNANELESDSSGSQGVKPGHGRTTSSTSMAKKSMDRTPSVHSAVLPTAAASQPISLRQPSAVSTNKRQPSAMSTRSFHSAKSSPTKSAHSVYGSAKSQIIEEDATRESHDPVESTRRRPNQDPHVMMVNTQTMPDFGKVPKLHYPGDDCKLHGPKTPILLPKNQLLVPGGQFDKIYSSKKTFPKLLDESNQTDTKAGDDVSHTSKLSLETISSLTDLSKKGTKRTSNFFGSWFRKGSIRSPSNSDAKKWKKG